MSKIIPISKNKTVVYAAEELKKYLDILKLEANIELGVYSDFNLENKVPNTELDDEIIINVKNGKGYISGSNPRSVLFSVYRYLENCGITWVRPGKKGTYLPKNPILADIDMREAASVRYRSICIEGACSIENMLDMIEWMPKHCYNTYHLQFMNCFTFFDRWYSHRNSTVKKPEPFDEHKAEEYVKLMEAEFAKREIIYIAIGHGWTCEPFGVRGDSWDPVDVSTLPEDFKKYAAMINGERKVFKNLPLNTQMCFSNPDLRKIITDYTVKYAEEHPYMDILSFSLADDFNNTCECEECSKLHFSDYYFMLLNEIDEKLTAKGLKTRILFENYCNLLHAPIKERLKNPDRFILMFCPISRTYCSTLPDSYELKEVPPYTVNKLIMPPTIEENLAYVYDYKQIFDGETLLFDYHLMWDHLLDAGAEGIARVLCEDIKKLKKLDIVGFISCQMQRCFFPTSLAMVAMGKTLWNTGLEFDDIKNDLYSVIFGEEADKMSEYLKVLSEAFDIGCLRSHKPFVQSELRERLVNAIAMMDDFKPYFAEMIEKTGDEKDLWKHLQLHRAMYSLIGESAIAKIDEDFELAKKKQSEASQILWENEDILQEVVDGMHFDEVTDYRIRVDGKRPGFSGTAV